MRFPWSLSALKGLDRSAPFDDGSPIQLCMGPLFPLLPLWVWLPPIGEDRANIMSAVYTAQAAVNTTRTVVQAAAK